MADITHSAQEKALQINLDSQRYGVFAEIGAGQEVARWFFHVGKASATVAKSISAYDMAVSDDLYGPTAHYVSRERLEAMLDRESRLLVERLGATRGEKCALFVFADTVATHASSRGLGGHGWMGVRFQAQPQAEVSEVILHFEMLDLLAVNQQEAVGLIGVNLLYGTFYHYDDPSLLIRMLMDGLSRRRMEVDMIKFSGPAFQAVDNRLMSLQLVEQNLTDAVMFTEKGEVVQPAEVLHKRAVLIERGSFRPVTNVTLAMADRALSQLGGSASAGEPAVLLEMTLNNLMSGTNVDHQDFLARVDILSALGKMVTISNYTTFNRVTDYLRLYTQERIGMVVGVPTLRAILEEKYYTDLQGGILEGLGRLFSGDVKLFVYPTIDPETGALETAGPVGVAAHLSHLCSYLYENGFIEPIRDFDTAQLQISPADVLQKIQAGDPSWESLVPAAAARLIKERGLFGYMPAKASSR